MRSIISVLVVATIAILIVQSSSTRRTSGKEMNAQQAQENVSEEFHQTYALPDGGRVSVKNIVGPVRIAAWDRSEVSVDAVKRATSQEILAEAQIKVEARPDAIDIETTYPISSNNKPASVEYTINVPRKAQLERIEIITGKLEIDNVSGDVSASNTNGQIIARGLTSEARLSTVNGRLEASFADLNKGKSILLKSVNGQITLRLPDNANADVKASSMRGRIKNDFGLTANRGELSGTSLAGVLGQGGSRITLDNMNGSIAILRSNGIAP
jgi:DUF4097 and DUF4098 domain-containing protein YvlB